MAVPRIKPNILSSEIHAHAHRRAVEAGCEIVYPLTDEPWGLRRFFVRDPNGAVINVTQHA
jgi:uncharacterized glyoxalase superfamily protein PhnB